MTQTKQKRPQVCQPESAYEMMIADKRYTYLASDYTGDLDACQHQVDAEVSDKFAKHRAKVSTLAQTYIDLDMDARAMRVADCGSLLAFRAPLDDLTQAKLFQANFCRDRLCPMCNWRRSLKFFGQVSKIMDGIGQEHQFIFVTLTVRSCSAAELSTVVNALQDGFKLFYKYKTISNAFKGYFKALEVTINLDNPAETQYHPHLHCIFAVSKKYFKGTEYVKQTALRDLWRKAMRLDYDPQVDIRKVHGKELHDGAIDIAPAIAETAKYAVKPGDYLVDDDKGRMEAVKALLDALTARRLVSLGGCFLTAQKALQLDDMVDGDLIHTDNDDMRPDVAYLVFRYNWQVGLGYVKGART